jgi:hypothetical protein
MMDESVLVLMQKTVVVRKLQESRKEVGKALVCLCMARISDLSMFLTVSRFAFRTGIYDICKMF